MQQKIINSVYGVFPITWIVPDLMGVPNQALRRAHLLNMSVEAARLYRKAGVGHLESAISQQSDLATQPGCRRVALIEHERVARRADDLVREIARLDISERVDRPASVVDQPDAGVVRLAAAVGALEAQGPIVAIDQHPRLKLLEPDHGPVSR